MAKKHNKGMTLSEILIAVLLITMAVLTLMQVIIAGLEAIQKGDQYSVATNLAKDRMERLREMEYYQLDSIYSTVFPWLHSDEVKDGLNIHMTISSEQTYSGGPKYKIVTVEVTSSLNTNARKSVRVILQNVITQDL